MTSKQVTSPPWNSRRLVHSKEMAWASRWSVALRAFYKQILSSSNCKDFFFKWHRPPRKLAKEVFVKFIPAKEKTRFAKEWRKVLAKDHVIRIDSHEVFNTAHICFCVLLAFVVIFEIHVEVWSKGESIPNWNCMVLQLCIRSRAVESASEGHFVPFDSRQSPQPDSQWFLCMVLLVCRLTASEWKDRANEIMLQCCAPSC